MKLLIVSMSLLLSSLHALAQKRMHLKGLYAQWGYNKEWYTKSNIHFSLSNGDNFTLLKAKAHDRPDFDAIYKSPLEITIPQFNYRVGFYLNTQRTKAFEIHFDHIKYVVTDYQKVKIQGVINNQVLNCDTLLDPNNFLHFEHSDGGNLFHFNYVQFVPLGKPHINNRAAFNLFYKAGAGFNIPRTDFSYNGDRLNNKFHIAGYNISAEGGARYYFFRNCFLEGAAKSGFVHYVNALANTNELNGNRAQHYFGYFEVVALFGIDIKFKQAKLAK
jgi:hypothetical protein